MCEFQTSDWALLEGWAALTVRLFMCAMPVLTAAHDLATATLFALFAALADGWSRLWGPCTSRSLVAGPDGLRLGYWLRRDQCVPWAAILAVQTFHHFNGIDYVAVHYRHAGRAAIATCRDLHSEEALAAFVRACAGYADSAARRRITLAGVCERSVCVPLFRRFVADVTLAALIGFAFGVASRGLLLGLPAALLTGSIAASRHAFRTITLVQEGGLWCSPGPEPRPLRTIPRPLRRWVRGLADAAYRSARLAPGQPAGQIADAPLFPGF